MAITIGGPTIGDADHRPGGTITIIGTLKLGGQRMLQAPTTSWAIDAGVIHRRMIDLGLTQRALADLANVHPDTLSDLFRARRQPHVGTIHELCRALGLDFHDLVRWSD